MPWPIRIYKRVQGFRDVRVDKTILIARAVALAGLVEVGVRTLPLPTLGRLLGIRMGTLPHEWNSQTPRPTADFADTVDAVDAVFRPWPVTGRCLRRSLVLGALLKRHSPWLRIGVAPLGGSVSAHAWIEIGGTRLPEPNNASSTAFVPLR